MNIHWFHRYHGSTPKDFKVISNILEDAGYYSMLTVYHSKISDSWIKIAHSLDPEHKLKYMIAMRTYAISPEYCAMLCEGFNEISPDRLMLNIAAGDIHVDETSVDDVVAISDLLKTHDDRVKYTSDWLEKFLNLEVLRNKPEIIISGTSENTINNANTYGDGHLSMYSSYKEGLNRLIKTPKRMVCLPMIIRDTHQEALEVYEKQPKNLGGMGLLSCLFGTEYEIIESIKNLEKEGVTDLLISKAHDDEQYYRIHSMVKRFNNK